jgi:AcrR family transcriptional regulator
MANLAEIIAAAAKVFQTKGYHAATVQDIADAVGILKGSLYHHVKSKEDLLYLIVKEPIARIYERMAEIVASELPDCGLDIRAGMGEQRPAGIFQTAARWSRHGGRHRREAHHLVPLSALNGKKVARDPTGARSTHVTGVRLAR